MENSNNSKKYYLGLDMGTDSCGWCVTDDKYNVIRSHKKTYGPDGKLIKERDAIYGVLDFLNQQIQLKIED